MVASGSVWLQTATGILIVAFLAIGLYGFRETNTAADYDVADRSAPALLVAGTVIASFLSASTFVGATGAGYSLGFGFILAVITTVTLGLLVLAVGFAGPIRALAEVTLPDFIGQRYDSTALQGAAGLIVFFIVTIYAGGALIGLTEILSQLLGVGYETALFVVTGIIIVYTVLGGMTSVVHTDGLQLIIMFVGAVLILPAAASTVGWQTGVNTISGMGWFTWNGPQDAVTSSMIVDQLVIWTFGTTALPFLFNRPFVAKSKKDAVKGIALGGVAFMFIGFAISLAVGFVHVTGVALETPDQAYPYMAMNMVPAVIGITALMGIMAAGISSSDTQLMTASLAVYRDLYQKALGRELSDRQSILFARALVATLGLLIFALAYVRPAQIFFIVAFAVGWSATTFFPAIAGGIYWDGGTRLGAAASIAVGFALLPIFQVAQIAFPFIISKTLVALVASAVVYVGVSLLDDSPSEAALAAYEELKGGRLIFRDVY